MPVRKFATHLWFDRQAEQAAKLYTSLFDDSSIDVVTPAPAGIPDVEAGSVFIVELTIMGQKYIFLNGGPQFPFNSQVSLYVGCDGQAEVDHYWAALLADGGQPGPVRLVDRPVRAVLADHSETAGGAHERCRSSGRKARHGRDAENGEDRCGRARGSGPRLVPRPRAGPGVSAPARPLVTGRALEARRLR